IGYQHWWTPELRSTVDFSMEHADANSFYLQASGRAAINKELNLAHANLIWSPVAFVDLGVEGAWGHRVTVSNLRGAAWTMQTSLKFSFSRPAVPTAPRRHPAGRRGAQFRASREADQRSDR